MPMINLLRSETAHQMEGEPTEIEVVLVPGIARIEYQDSSYFDVNYMRFHELNLQPTETGWRVCWFSQPVP